MFPFIPCTAGCGQPATSGSTLCADHCVDRREESARVAALIMNARDVRNLSAGRLVFQDLDFSGKNFLESSFYKSSFINCTFSRAFLRTVFFDFAQFSHCDLQKTTIEFSSFGGARIEDCSFSHSELIHLNFSGADIDGCDFSQSDLYNSRFILARMRDVLMVDCNVKKVFFINTDTSGVNFKQSNPKEAVFKFEGDL